jgi:hypothetical protein
LIVDAEVYVAVFVTECNPVLPGLLLSNEEFKIELDPDIPCVPLGPKLPEGPWIPYLKSEIVSILLPTGQPGLIKKGVMRL